MLNNFISSSTVQSIKDAMTPVATAIGKGAEYGWTIVIKQMYVQGIGYALAAICSFAIAWTLFYWGREWLKEAKAYKNNNSYSTDGDGLYMGAFIFLTLSAFVLSFGVMSVYAAIAHFINPDFYALQFLIDAVKPASGN